MEPFISIQEYLKKSIEEQGTAPMCLSTITKDGFPNSRFVDLKSVNADELLFGTDIRSTKSKEFSKKNRVAVCIWNKKQAIQIRIIGKIKPADNEISDKIFSSRNITAQAIANVSIQSEDLVDINDLKMKVATFIAASNGKIERPKTWCIYRIIPKEIEILKFTDDRIHNRILYKKKNDVWISKQLSP